MRTDTDRRECDFCGKQYSGSVDFEPVHIGDLPAPEPSAAEQTASTAGRTQEREGFTMALWKSIEGLGCTEITRKPYVERIDPAMWDSVPVGLEETTSLSEMSQPTTERIEEAVATHVRIDHPAPEPDPDMWMCEHCVSSLK